jgi:hypothetical protein
MEWWTRSFDEPQPFEPAPPAPGYVEDEDEGAIAYNTVESPKRRDVEILIGSPWPFERHEVDRSSGPGYPGPVHVELRTPEIVDGNHHPGSQRLVQPASAVVTQAPDGPQHVKQAEQANK